MKKLQPSIFNDVIGPIMRGPSSSHVAGAARISSLVRQCMKDDVKKVLVDFDPNGSLAESYHGHGTDMGFVAGIMNMDLTDPQVFRACEIAKEKNIDVQFRIYEYGANHPNFYRIYAENGQGYSCRWDAISVGGGMIEMIKYNDFEVSIAGDFYELLVTMDENADDQQVKELVGNWEYCIEVKAESCKLLQFKRSQPMAADKKHNIKVLEEVKECVYLEPILPVHSRKNIQVPFLSAAELLEKFDCEKEMWEYAVMYECQRGNLTEQEVMDKMNILVDIMEGAVDGGLAGTDYEDRILGPQSQLIAEAENLVPCSILNEVIQDITAIMETKSSMGVIVAAPTAGACACLPGTLIGAARYMKLDRIELIKGMLAAGLTGVFIAEGSTFAAEVAGCQAECGSGSGMAAAGLVQLMQGTAAQAMNAASIALQNISGLACDPVANRVEVPCLGKNVMGGSNAISSANMILSGFDKVIPLDQTIAAIYDIGIKLPLELRCTYGGLGKTDASNELKKNLK